MIDGDRSCAKKDESKGESGDGERELDAGTIGGAQEAVVPVNFPNGDGQVDADGQRRGTGEEPDQDQQASDELGAKGYIAEPSGDAEIADELGEMMQAAGDFVISMRDHNDANSQAHDKKGERL